MCSTSNSIRLTVKWQLDAAMLSRPVNLNVLVALSKSNPEKFLQDNALSLMITTLLNEKNSKISNKDTKLDILNILANVARGDKDCVDEVRSALKCINEWFDEYIAESENNQSHPEENRSQSTFYNEPELHKVMVLLLARCWDYKLKAEDILELTRGDRALALTTVVNLLEEGETFTTELKQRKKPGQGQLGQWEHRTVYERYEKELLLQICQLLRAFTHPATYFGSKIDSDITLHKVEQFSTEIDNLLQIALTSQFVEKLSHALFGCLFEKLNDQQEMKSDDANLEENDHLAVLCIQTFLQNLYFFASDNTESFRMHLLTESMLIPRIILPYINSCSRDLRTIHTNIANKNQDELISGLTAALRTLVIATFNAQHVESIRFLRTNNPTIGLLHARDLCIDSDYLYSLLCMLYINLGTLCSHSSDEDDGSDEILRELIHTYEQMGRAACSRVARRLDSSGALPLSRDSDSYRILYKAFERKAGKHEGLVSGYEIQETELDRTDPSDVVVKSNIKEVRIDRRSSSKNMSTSKSNASSNLSQHHDKEELGGTDSNIPKVRSWKES